MNPPQLDLAFWAPDKAGAEAQAVAWAEAEPNIASARVLHAFLVAPHRTLWTVTLAIEWVHDDGQEELGL